MLAAAPVAAAPYSSSFYQQRAYKLKLCHSQWQWQPHASGNRMLAFFIVALQDGPAPLSEKNSGKFRFWHDERRFKGGIEKCLVQQTLFAAGA
jgi:hypothetical protein